MKDIFKKLDKPLLILTILFAAIGLVMIFSSSSIAAVLQYKSTEYHFFYKQALVISVGIILSLIIYAIPTKWYKSLSLIGLGIIIIVLLGLKTYGQVTNSARSWFKIAGFSIQPSEFAKTVIILYLATWYGSKKKFKSIFDTFLPLIPCIVIFFLVASEPDLGTACIIGCICMFIFFTLPFNKNKPMFFIKLITITLIIGGIIFLNTNTEFLNKFLTSTQASRFNFKQPCSRYLEETGYQVCNGYIAINNGGLLGVGLGKSTQKYLYLPEAHTDFIFPILVEELGLIVGGLVLIGYGVILYRILKIAKMADNPRGAILAFGTFLMLLFHLLVNFMGILALIPLTGVPVPFLSYGGSYTINVFIMIFVVQRVAIETKNNQAKREIAEISKK